MRSLGVTLAPSGKPGKAGVTIAEVAPGSVAARHGLRPGDIILQAGGKTVSGAGDVSGALRDAASHDKPVLLLVERGDHRRFVRNRAPPRLTTPSATGESTGPPVASSPDSHARPGPRLRGPGLCAFPALHIPIDCV